MKQLDLAQVAPSDAAFGALSERRRIIGLLLKHVGLHKLAGRISVANALDAIVTEIEGGE